MEPVVYLALDPGDNTGWCTFDANGEIVNQGLCSNLDGRESLYNLLQEMHKEVRLKLVICENYALFPWKSKEQSWSDLNTPRVIGVIEYWCYLTKIELELQPPNIKMIAYRWAGLTPAKNKKMSHSLDAYVHGIYYLQKNGIRKAQQG